MRDLLELYASYRDLHDQRHVVICRILQIFFDKIMSMGVDTPEGFDEYATVIRELIDHDVGRNIGPRLRLKTSEMWMIYLVKHTQGSFTCYMMAKSCAYMFGVVRDGEVMSSEHMNDLAIIANLLYYGNPNDKYNSLSIYDDVGFDMVYNMMKDGFEHESLHDS